MTVPPIIQIIILSMIFQDIIDSKDMMEQVRVKLTEAYYHRDTQKQLIDLTNTNDVTVFNENVLKNKDLLLKLSGYETVPARTPPPNTAEQLNAAPAAPAPPPRG